ncbi:MAG: GIN domain-containing protein [Gammaproteobacteria bacterium]
MAITVRFFGLLLITSVLLGCTHVSQRPSFNISPKEGVDPFNAVTIMGDMDVRIDTSQSFYDVAVTSGEGDLKTITMTVKNHQLFLKRAHDFSHDKMSVVIYTPRLDKFTYSGAGNAYINHIRAHNLRVRVLRQGFVTLSGRAKELQATVTGHGRLNARCLYADTVYVNTTGLGQAEVRNINGLSALAAGYSDIYYYQDPHGKFPYLRGSGTVLRMVGLQHCSII